MKKNLQLLSVILLLNVGISFGQGALSFDGYDYVKVPEISQIIRDSARTVEAWIKVPAETNPEQVLIQYGIDASGKKFTIRLDKGVEDVAQFLRVEHGGGFKRGGTSLNDDAWHHVAVVVEAGSGILDAKLYVDGNEETYEQSATNVLFDTDTMFVLIGQANTKESNYVSRIPGRNWIGLIDELRIWNKALSETEIAEVKDSILCSSLNPNLVASYRFDDGSGTTVMDETGVYDGEFSTVSDTLHPTWTDGNADLVLTTVCAALTNVEYDNIDNTVYLHPNPANNFVKLEFDEQIEKAIVYNLIGTEIMNFIHPNNNTLNISNLKPGIYMLRLYATKQKEIGSLKFIKK